MEGGVEVPSEFALSGDGTLSAFLTPSMAESSFATGALPDE
jgi:hypothetical protein